MSVDPNTFQPGISQGAVQQGMPPAPAVNPAQAADVAGQQAQMQQQQAPAAPAPKPPSMIPSDVAVLMAQSFNKAKMETARGLVQSLGPPRGSVNAKDADLVRVWRKRNPDIDPLWEKLINGLSDEEIMYAMYPARRALIRYGHRTYTEQVDFAEHMAELDRDPRFDNLDTPEEDPETGDSTYTPPQAKFPSRGEENYKKKKKQDQQRKKDQKDQSSPKDQLFENYG